LKAFPILLFATLEVVLLFFAELPAQEVDPIPPQPAPAKARLLQAGDIIRFEIEEEERPKPQLLRVMASGEVLVPHVGLILAAGKSTEEFAEIVSSELEKEFFKKATVKALIAPEAAPAEGTDGYGDLFNRRDREAKQNASVTLYGPFANRGTHQLGPKLKTVGDLLKLGGPLPKTGVREKLRLYRLHPENPGMGTVLLNPTDDEVLQAGD